MSTGNCYDDGFPPGPGAYPPQSIYHVISPIGDDYASRDAWMASVSQIFQYAGWSQIIVKSFSLLYMGSPYGPSYQDATYNLDDPSPFWDMGPLTAAGQALIVDGIPDGLIGGIPVAPAAPYYYYFDFMTFPNARLPVLQAVTRYYQGRGWQPGSLVVEDAEGNLYVAMNAPSWTSITPYNTGLAIGVTISTGGQSVGGGFIFTSPGGEIQVYICQGVGIANVPNNYMSAGTEIPMAKDAPIPPFFCGFGLHSDFHTYAIQQLNDGTTAYDLNTFVGSNLYTVLIVTPSSYYMHTQEGADTRPGDFAFGAVLQAIPGNPASAPSIYCCQGSSFASEQGGRAILGYNPGNVFISCLGQIQSDEHDAGGSAALMLTAYARGTPTAAATPILWEGDGTNNGPAEILDPWCQINPGGSSLAVLGVMPDAFVTTDVVSSCDTLPAVSWDNHNWKAYTLNNTGVIEGAAGTLFVRVDNIISPFIPAEAGNDLTTLIIHANAGKVVSVIYAPPASVFVDGMTDDTWGMFMCMGEPSLTAYATFATPIGYNYFYWLPTDDDATVGAFFFTVKVQGDTIISRQTCNGNDPPGVLQPFEVIVHQVPFSQLFDTNANNTVSLQQGFPVPASVDLQITGGWAPYIITVSDSPPGTSFSYVGSTGTGTWTGVPTTAGTYPFVVTFDDALGDDGSRPAPGVPGPTISGPRTFTFIVIPTTVAWPYSGTLTGKVGTALSIDLGPNGGLQPYTFSIVTDPDPPAGYTPSLPPGLGITDTPEFVILQGTPTTAGHYAFMIYATDSNHHLAIAEVLMIISA